MSRARAEHAAPAAARRLVKLLVGCLLAFGVLALAECRAVAGRAAGGADPAGDAPSAAGTPVAHAADPAR